jgi:DNA-binding transcriptional MocR family regulator
LTIRDGRVVPGDLLPPVRSLADALGVSPATGNPDPELLAPLARVLQRIDARLYLCAQQHELPALREIPAKAFEADGIPALHLGVVSGALDGVERVLVAQLRPGDRVGFEDPGFSIVLDLVAALGLEVVPMAIDDRGILPAAIAGDRETIARVAGRQRIGFRWVSHLLQRIVAELESDAANRRRVQRAAALYAERRQTLVAALAARDIVSHGRSGLNVWVPVPEEVPVVQSLLTAGFAVSAGERFRLRTGPAIRVTIATLAPAMVPALADAIAASFGSPGRSARS